MNRETRILIALVFVNFVSVSGFGLMFPVFPIHGDQIGASATDLAWAIAAFSLGQLVSGPMMGRLSDRLGRRPILIVGLVLGALLYVVHVFTLSPLTLIIARFGSGLASGSFAIAYAVGADISNRDNRARVMGIIGAGFASGIILGPAIGGLSAGLVGEQSAFTVVCLVSAVMSLLAAAATALLLPETSGERQSAGTAAKTRSIILLRNPAFTIPVLLGFAGMAAVAMMEGTFVLFADDVLGLSPLGIGLMFTVLGVAAVAVQAFGAGPVSRRFGETRMMAIAMILQCSGMLLLGLSTTVWTALPAMICLAGGYALLQPAVASLASFNAPPHMQGAAQGIVQGLSALGRVLGPASAGPIYDAYGPPSPFFVGAALLAATVGIVLYYYPKQPLDAEA